MGSVGNKIYVFGGCDDGYTKLSSAAVYDISFQKWSKLPDMKKKRNCCAATAVGKRIFIVGGHEGPSAHSSCEVFDTSTNTWSSPIPDLKEKRRGCQAVTICTDIYVMGGFNGFTHNSSVEMFEISISSLYPTNHNYITVEGRYRSPKLLENLCIDQICRSLPDLDGDIPPRHPQYIINAILESLMSHGALNTTTLRPFRHYEIVQLPLVSYKDEVDAVVDETANGSVCYFQKNIRLKQTRKQGSRNNGTESHHQKKAKMTTNNVSRSNRK